ncbi:uncharacterized protein LOC143921347 [Arctopsyche grandis]|uniref:uncharacterized protein LOC143921347 n=1 Tax=Arctopsyche grandis TaxID=121162 RepID=UPI00406D6BD3
MECRLCLSHISTESSVSLYDNPHPLKQQILNTCRLNVHYDDSSPKSICASCESTLKLLSDFKNTCIQNDEISRHKLDECADVKTEEVMLEDIVWEDESNSDSHLQVRSSPHKLKPHMQSAQQPHTVASFGNAQVDFASGTLRGNDLMNVVPSISHEENTLLSTTIAAASFILLYYIKMKRKRRRLGRC